MRRFVKVEWDILERGCWYYHPSVLTVGSCVSMPDLPSPFVLVLCRSMDTSCCWLAGIVSCVSVRAILCSISRARVVDKNCIFFFFQCTHRMDNWCTVRRYSLNINNLQTDSLHLIQQSCQFFLTGSSWSHEDKLSVTVNIFNVVIFLYIKDWLY